MDPLVVGFLGFAVLLALICLRVWIAVAAAIVGVLGLWYLAGLDRTITLVGLTPFAKTFDYNFSVIPLFILMGYLAFDAGIAEKGFTAARALVGRIRGGLAIATVFGSALFAAACGNSTAATAVLAKICYPELQRAGYDKKLSLGVITCVGTFASMIPPSTLMVVYAVMADVSVGKVLIAGVIPGVITAVLYAAFIITRVKLNPSLAPLEPPTTWGVKMKGIAGAWGILLSILIIIGGIMSGIATPTEAGGLGAIAMFIIGVALKKFSWKSLSKTMLGTAEMTAMVFFVLVGIFIFSAFLSYSRLPNALGEWTSALPIPPFAVLMLIAIIFSLLGMFMLATAVVVLLVPIFAPSVEKLGYDLIWFGVFIVKLCEIAVVTPPVGMSLYVMKGVIPSAELSEIIMGATPFLILEAFLLILLLAFPQIALWLPNMMTG
ncbi:MAG: TRAP transporter large permease [Dehalococcoidales bacterium]|nr:TRAP transporter large permease [Dehalococcoidales bacterium]